MGKYRFGVFLPFYAYQAKTPTEQYEWLKTVILECEHLGYDSVWLDDHLMYNEWSLFENWTTLAALSSLTSRIRLGCMVSCVAHRNPSLLAKAAATLDVLSGGRLEFGIGAGVQEAEHLAYGFDFPTASVRIERLSEALEVITHLWIQKKATYQGKYYKLKEAVCEPKPLQKPHPPITVGGSGKRLLKVTAQYADRFDWGFVPSVEEYKHKLSILEEQCKAVGRNSSEVERSCWPSGQILIAQNQKELDEKVLKHKPPNMSLEDFKQGTLIGTPIECRVALQTYADLGVTYFMLYFGDLPSLDGIRLFAQTVARSP